MTYGQVEWRHSKPNEPRWLYSELDDVLMERRKIEIFPDGRYGFADGRTEVGGTSLGKVSIPGVEESNADPQFEGVEIGRKSSRVSGQRGW